MRLFWAGAGSVVTLVGLQVYSYCNEKLYERWFHDRTGMLLRRHDPSVELALAKQLFYANQSLTFARGLIESQKTATANFEALAKQQRELMRAEEERTKILTVALYFGYQEIQKKVFEPGSFADFISEEEDSPKELKWPRLVV